MAILPPRYVRQLSSCTDLTAVSGGVGLADVCDGQSVGAVVPVVGDLHPLVVKLELGPLGQGQGVLTQAHP